MDVLVYVDPSPRGEWALTLAAQLPPSWAQSVRLLGTTEDVAGHPGLLERARATFAGRATTLVTRAGPAERAVVEEARAGAFGLVVVPPAGRGALARMLRGSRVATVVRALRAPVLIARRPPARVERVLGALSGRRSTDAVVAAALEWQRKAGARASFVHVSSGVALPLGGGPALAAAGADPEAAAVATAMRAGGVEGRLELRDGLVVDEVLDAFESGAHQLLIVGARGEEDAAFGREDVTERLLLACPGSTLIVPRPLTASELRPIL
jgi:nucleotide-binding universal stress UspA family protein